MNSIINAELKKVKAVELNVEEGIHTFYIPKTTQIRTTSITKGSIYVIELDDAVLNPTSNSTLASNWNAGMIPKHKVYKAEVIDLIGNSMAKFNGIAIEDDQEIFSDNWYGWLPFNSFKVISKES